MLLIHLFIALINYKGDSISKIDSIGEQIKFDKNNLESIKSLFNNCYSTNNSLSNSNMDNNDVLEILLFQQYFLNLLFSHFTNIYNIIFKRESMNLGGIKLKNLYIIDASTLSILFDLRQTQKRKNNYKYYKNELLMKEILYQSNILYQYYLNSYKNNNQSKTKYLLFECTSAFPRLLFIFKFIPVLKGLIIIHLYHQRKLSRKGDSPYHEIELTFCSPESKNKKSQEFQYCEPKKLVIINKFLEEFYLTSRKTDLFRIVNSNKKFKYFNYLAVNAINSISMKDSMTNDIDAIFKNINDKIQEQILENKKNKDLNTTGESSFDKILDVDISNIYKELYTDCENNTKHENNEIKYELPSFENSDINFRNKNDNESDNYVLSKRNITIIFDNNLSDTKTKYYNHLDDIKINNNINNTKESKDQIIDKEVSDSMNLTNIDFITKIYENSNNGVNDNFSLISAVEQASNNNLKEIEIHKNNKNLSAKKKVKSNINILDLLDLSNTKSINKNSNNRKVIQESEENRLDLSEDNENNNSEQSSVTKLQLDKSKINKRTRNKLTILDADRINIKSPLRKTPLN